MFGWKLNKIYLYPYGGLTKFDVDINVSIKSEFIVLIMGSLFQIIYLIIGKYIFIDSYLTFKYYNLSILLFNLIPIYPLDGGRILNLFFNKFISFFHSLYLSIIISFIIIIYFLYININVINYFIIFIIILIKVISEYKNINLYFNKFLLERYFNNYRYNSIIRVNVIKKMMREKSHIIKFKNNYISEKEYLDILYSSKR